MWKYYDFKCKECGRLEERLVGSIDEPQTCNAPVEWKPGVDDRVVCGGEMVREMPAVHVTPEWQVPMGR